MYVLNKYIYIYMVYTYVYMCVMYSAKLQYIQLSAFSLRNIHKSLPTLDALQHLESLFKHCNKTTTSF